jgi:hypothetical protein
MKTLAHLAGFSTLIAAGLSGCASSQAILSGWLKAHTVDALPRSPSTEPLEALMRGLPLDAAEQQELARYILRHHPLDLIEGDNAESLRKAVNTALAPDEALLLICDDGLVNVQFDSVEEIPDGTRAEILDVIAHLNSGCAMLRERLGPSAWPAHTVTVFRVFPTGKRYLEAYPESIGTLGSYVGKRTIASYVDAIISEQGPIVVHEATHEAQDNATDRGYKIFSKVITEGMAVLLSVPKPAFYFGGPMHSPQRFCCKPPVDKGDYFYYHRVMSCLERVLGTREETDANLREILTFGRPALTIERSTGLSPPKLEELTQRGCQYDTWRELIDGSPAH